MTIRQFDYTHLLLVSFSLAVLSNANHAFAAGNIDSTYKYAFSNIGGYVNFAPTNGGVVVTDKAVTGFAWSANDGWINFSPSNGGVRNDGNGNLSGFAWDATAGWINFNGVTIDSSGEFHGVANGALVGSVNYAINFDCSHCSVVTSWRHKSHSSYTPLYLNNLATVQAAIPTPNPPVMTPDVSPVSVPVVPNAKKARANTNSVAAIAAAEAGTSTVEQSRGVSPRTSTPKATSSPVSSISKLIPSVTVVATGLSILISIGILILFFL